MRVRTADLVAQIDAVLAAHAELVSRAKYDDLSDMKPQRDEIVLGFKPPWTAWLLQHRPTHAKRLASALSRQAIESAD